MKISRKMEKPNKALALPEDAKDGELAPSLYIHQLSKPIEGLPETGPFQAHLKGKVRRHSVTTEGGKTHHSYDLDCHDLECEGKDNGKGKQRESTREGVDKAFKKYDQEEEEKKKPKAAKGPKDEED